jgi:hypothetical protein
MSPLLALTSNCCTAQNSDTLAIIADMPPAPEGSGTRAYDPLRTSDQSSSCVTQTIQPCDQGIARLRLGIVGVTHSPNAAGCRLGGIGRPASDHVAPPALACIRRIACRWRGVTRAASQIASAPADCHRTAPPSSLWRGTRMDRAMVKKTSRARRRKTNGPLAQLAPERRARQVPGLHRGA